MMKTRKAVLQGRPHSTYVLVPRTYVDITRPARQAPIRHKINSSLIDSWLCRAQPGINRDLRWYAALPHQVPSCTTISITSHETYTLFDRLVSAQ
ncbi:hypothetical protein BDR03DRAFT_939886 [Suillus americanus]|nr:hypothetical protein BDR03DRAFT_939886 [Suillus americanus]